MEKTYKMPAVCWLKVTDYMHGWLQSELGGSARVGEQRVICVQHLSGAREVLKMETDEDMASRHPVGNAMSATRRNCIMAGMEIDEAVMEHDYGVTRETLRLFVPIECPRMRLTRRGLLRPWTLDVNLSREQAIAMQRILRAAFWQAVEDFNEGYARRAGSTRYPSIDMVEAFCRETGTPDIYAEAIKREWNRRVKRGDNRKVKSGE